MHAQYAELVRDAAREGRAVGAFTCYDASTAAGVLEAGAERDAGVILLLAPASFARSDGPLRARALVAMAGAASCPACVQLDHVADPSAMHAAAEAGVQAVLADGSKLPLEANVRLVADARTALGPAVGIEAELGHVAGDEDVARAARHGQLTDPAEAASFVEASGADCLAVSIGNVHGAYAAPPALDWERLARIRGGLDVPLALHGASGLPVADVRHAIDLGIAKVNVNTEIRERQFAALGERLADLSAGAHMLELVDLLRREACATALRILAVLDPRTKLPR